MKKIFIQISFVLGFLTAFGQTWTDIPNPLNGSSGNHFLSISFQDSMNGVAVGYQNANATAIKSTSGGNTWSLLNNLPSGQSELDDVKYVNGNIYAVSQAGADRLGFIKSVDGGSSFSLNDTVDHNNTNYLFGSAMETHQLAFLDGSFGVMWGWLKDYSYPGPGTICKTTNGGSSWSSIYSTPGHCCTAWGEIRNMFIQSTQNIFAVFNYGGDDSLLVSNNGGVTWREKGFAPYSGITSLYFFDNLSGFAVGSNSVIIHTTDGGTSWTPISFFLQADNFKKILFTDSQTGWIVGNKKIYKSEDGGATWQVSGSFPVRINDLTMLSSNSGFACGDSGKIYKYTCASVTTILTHSICNGQSFVIGSQAFNTTGNHSATLKSVGGCDSIVQLNLTVEPLPNPTITDNAGTLSTGIFSSYQWYYNGAPLTTGGTSQTYTPLIPGGYTVRVTNTNDCDSISAVYNITSVGMEDISFSHLSISPNPAKNHINIDLAGENFDYMLYDLTGRVLRSEQNINGHVVVNIDGFSMGEYFFRITNSQGQAVRKFTLE